MYNDFIFTFIGESFGFVGCVAVVAALSIICGRMLWTGAVSRSYVGKYICTGIFAMLAFVVIYSVVGIDYTNPQTGETMHYNATPIQSIQVGFSYIAVVFQAILGLFNPETAAQTVSDSTSIVGIAVMSADFFAQGFVDALFFMAAISVSLGLMNLLPIPALDGGRLVFLVVEAVRGRRLDPNKEGAVNLVFLMLLMVLMVVIMFNDIRKIVM